jgi:hypothetical protein
MRKIINIVAMLEIETGKLFTNPTAADPNAT